VGAVVVAVGFAIKEALDAYEPEWAAPEEVCVHRTLWNTDSGQLETTLLGAGPTGVKYLELRGRLAPSGWFTSLW
jgi:hypothetical protein